MTVMPFNPGVFDAALDANEAERRRVAEQQEQNEDFERGVESSRSSGAELNSNVLAGLDWAFRDLPRNATIGALRGAVNTIEALDSAFSGYQEFVTSGQNPAGRGLQAAATGTSLQPTEPDVEPASVRETFPGAFEAVEEFFDAASANNRPVDDVVQGLGQFAVPFTGYLKLLGGLKNVSMFSRLGKLFVAEGVTAATAFEAHENRFAELFRVGQQMENDFGAVLNRISPEGSLVNSYIGYMTDNRENESEWEARFKNAADSLVGTVAIGGLLTAVVKSLRGARKVLSDSETLSIADQPGMQVLDDG